MASKATVLIIDDEQNICQILTKILSREGYNTVTANFGAKGVELFSSEQVDVVLLDSMFHFYKNDREKETAFLHRVMGELVFRGLICIIISKSKRIEKELSDVFNESEFNWVSLFDEYVDYPDKRIKMRMIVSRKEKKE